MKDLFYTVLVICLALLITIALKPTDQACKAAVNHQQPGGQILQLLDLDSYAIKIEDHVFYKEIYTVTGQQIGTAFLTQVILN